MSQVKNPKSVVETDSVNIGSQYHFEPLELIMGFKNIIPTTIEVIIADKSNNNMDGSRK